MRGAGTACARGKPDARARIPIPSNRCIIAVNQRLLFGNPAVTKSIVESSPAWAETRGVPAHAGDLPTMLISRSPKVPRLGNTLPPLTAAGLISQTRMKTFNQGVPGSIPGWFTTKQSALLSHLWLAGRFCFSKKGIPN